MLNKNYAYCALEIAEDGHIEFIENKPTNQSQQEWDRPWTKKELTYSIISGTEDIPKTSKEFKALGIALTSWGAEVDLKFSRVKPTENPDIRISFEKSDINTTFKENPNVLAYAYMPGQGKVSGIVVFNEDKTWDLSENYVNGKKVYSLYHVMIHELGHTLGLRHDEKSETWDIMDPYYNPKVEMPSPNDIYRIRKLYPIRDFGNWSRYDRLKNALLRIIRRG